ncbi:hypothetical protein C8R44DRAFT_440190 [Mycena epipterygia]|nr:hypothetical protein C8R44DRAFT_440190 [Mycena epipterygia]
MGRTIDIRRRAPYARDGTPHECSPPERSKRITSGMPRSPSSARTPSTRTSRPTICVLSPFFRNRSRPHPRLTIPPLPHSDLPRLPPMTPQRPPLRPQAAHRAQDNRHPRLGALVLCKDHYEPQRSCFCGVCLCDGVLGCMVKQDLVRVAQEALAHAERALWKMGQIYHGGCGERRVRGARGGGEDGREGAARGGDGGTRRDRGQRGRGDVPQRLCDVSRVSRRVALALCGARIGARALLQFRFPIEFDSSAFEYDRGRA